jgi:hypothetical protein
MQEVRRTHVTRNAARFSRLQQVRRMPRYASTVRPAPSDGMHFDIRVRSELRHALPADEATRASYEDPPLAGHAA